MRSFGSAFSGSGPRRPSLLATAVAVIIAWCIVAGAQVTVPFPNFTVGTVADPSQVNANFSALSNQSLNRTNGTMTGVLNTQSVLPTIDATYALGDGTHRYTNGFFSGALTVGGALTAGSFVGAGTSLTGIAYQGKQTLWVPANSMSPTVTNGAAGPSIAELTAGNPNITTLSFVNGSQKNAQFAIAFPKSWNAGTVTYQAFWTGTAAGAGTTIWGLQCLAVADGVSTDAAFGTAVEVSDTFLTVKQIHVASESSVVTISGAAADTHTTCQVYRKGATDTRAQPSLLLGIKLFFTTNAANDQ